MTDEEIINKHNPGVRARARLELQIVNKLIAVAHETGHTLRVMEYEEDNEGELNYDVKMELFDLDEANVRIYDSAGKYVGRVYLVFGNDGFDLISDYTLGAETFLQPVLKLADSLG